MKNKKRKRYNFRVGQRVTVLRDIYRRTPAGRDTLYCKSGDQGLITELIVYYNVPWYDNWWFKVKVKLDSGLIRNLRPSSLRREKEPKKNYGRKGRQRKTCYEAYEKIPTYKHNL